MKKKLELEVSQSAKKVISPPNLCVFICGKPGKAQNVQVLFLKRCAA